MEFGSPFRDIANRLGFGAKNEAQSSQVDKTTQLNQAQEQVTNQSQNKVASETAGTAAPVAATESAQPIAQPETTAEKESTQAIIQHIFTAAEQFRAANLKRGDVRPGEIEVSITNADGTTNKVGVPDLKTSPAGLMRPEVKLAGIVIKDATNKVTHEVTVRQWSKSGQVLVSYAEPGTGDKLWQRTAKNDKGEDMVLMTAAQAEQLLPELKKIDQLLTQAAQTNEGQAYQSQTGTVKDGPALEFQQARDSQESIRAVNHTMELAYQLYKKFLVVEGLTSGPGIQRATEQAETVIHQGKTYQVMVPRFAIGMNGERPYPNQEFSLRVSELGVDGKATSFDQMTFQTKVGENAWTFQSSETSQPVSFDQAVRLDPTVKVAEKLLGQALVQIEQRLRANPRYAPDQPVSV